MVRFLVAFLVLAGVLAPACAGSAARPGGVDAASSSAGAVPLIARDALFGNPTRNGARISPDGRWLSWLAPRDGVLNVWVAPADAPARARPLTTERSRPIRTMGWSPDSTRVLFVNDRGGDENFLLYGVDVESGVQRSYTPFDKARVKILATSRKVPGRILLGIARRDPHWQDVYSLDLASGALTLVLRNDAYDTFLADDDLDLRLAERTRDDGGVDWLRVIDDRVDDTPIAHLEMDDALATAPLSFTADGKTLYWLDSRAGDTVALVAQDTANGHARTTARDARADIESGLFDPRTGALQAYALDVLATHYVATDPAIVPDLAFLAHAARGQFTITSRSDDDRKWVVVIDRVTSPPSTWLYDRRARKLTPLFVGRAALADAPLVPMQAVEIPARDGLKLVSYLSLPAQTGAAAGRPTRPVPMVLFVHGGPWERDTWGYNGAHQWLANRGYAVLSVNFRGSSGFGKRFVAAGDRQWGLRMQDDLLDAVDWAVAHGVTTRDRVAIMGGSYGGYATLAGLAFTPTAFACGVDIVGPSNLPALLQSLPPTWESFRQQFYRRVGDPTTAAGLAMLEERSPVNFAGRIVRPLLIGQGANDPRVDESESDQIVAALRSRHIPVTYVVFPDEGHGFARPANNLAFLAIAETFLGQCLGGRVEPIGDAVTASTAQMREGVDLAPGARDAAHATDGETPPASVSRAVIHVPGAGSGNENQCRASATSAAMPACKAASEP